ncbi:hypothetical protein FSP39_003175 [Pinctada imbricata]|uniref:Uncharacterized protein n=1 Tax=Pinctada imbricata TaxID=66713 RepID=A0AA88XVP0_PINIB|nr:hypothetical protein FSP39_003175 [Pinctada imbricata]
MVLREETILQVKSKVSEMEKNSDLYFVQDFIGVPLHSSAPVSRSKSDSRDSDRMNACMANNLFHSVFKGRFRKVKLILDRGYNVNNKNNYGYSVLIAALHIEDDVKRDKMFRYLMHRHADITAKDPKHGRSILSWASLLGRNDQVVLMLESLKGDFDLREQDYDGMTALHQATQSGHIDVVRTLVQEFRKYRLSVDVADRLGLTPYLHAKRLGYTEICNILQVDGRACPGQSDSFTFRSSSEWSEIGATIKQKKHLQQRMTCFEHAAIHGSSKSFRNFFGSESVPAVGVSVPEDTEKPEKVTYWVVKNVPPKYRTENDQLSRSTDFVEFNRLNKSKQREMSKSNPNPTFSLLELTPGAKAISANEFKHSETDTSKIEPAAKVDSSTHHQHHHSHKPSQMQSLGAIMAALADQQTSSYRQTVRVTPPAENLPPSRAKRSTFSIIFGKDELKKKKKGKGSGKSCQNSKKKGSNFLKPPKR